VGYTKEFPMSARYYRTLSLLIRLARARGDGAEVERLIQKGVDRGVPEEVLRGASA